MIISRLTGVLFLVLFVAYGYFAGQIPLDFWSQQEAFNARSLPYLISAAGSFLALLCIVIPPKIDLPEQPLHWRPALALLALLYAYGHAIEWLGFAVSTIALLFGGFAILNERRWPRMLAVALLLTGGFWLLMDALGIYLAPGELILRFTDD